MKLLFVGDTHGVTHLDKIPAFLHQAQLGATDAVIHCGDIGIAWQGAEDEALRFWRGLPCKVLVCLGNHENYPWVAAQTLITRYGCRGHDLGGRVFAPLAGQTARLSGKTLWFYPGGYSVDFMFRTPGRSIHREELLPAKEAEGLINRRLSGARRDYIVSHDGPRAFVIQHFGFDIGLPHMHYWSLMGEEPGSRAHPGFMLDALYRREELYGQWYFGHHHLDVAEGKLRCLYKQAALVDTRDGSTRLLSAE